MLLNNAGQYMDYPQPLEDFSHAFLAGHLTINALAPTLASGVARRDAGRRHAAVQGLPAAGSSCGAAHWANRSTPPIPPLPQLCKLVLPGMKARRRGLIVNVGSGVACAMLEAPYLAGARCGGGGGGGAAHIHCRRCSGSGTVCRCSPSPSPPDSLRRLQGLPRLPHPRPGRRVRAARRAGSESVVGGHGGEETLGIPLRVVGRVADCCRASLVSSLPLVGALVLQAHVGCH